MTHARHAHGPLVRALREARGMSLVDLGFAADVNFGYLSRLERQQDRRASWEVTRRLAEALEVDPAVLTGQIPPYRELRQKITGWSVERFADEVGLSPTDYDAIEQGVAMPGAEMAALIAHRLGVPTEVLVEPRGEEGEQK